MLDKHEVSGSIPEWPTNLKPRVHSGFFYCFRLELRKVRRFDKVQSAGSIEQHQLRCRCALEAGSSDPLRSRISRGRRQGFRRIRLWCGTVVWLLGRYEFGHRAPLRALDGTPGGRSDGPIGIPERGSCRLARGAPRRADHVALGAGHATTLHVPDSPWRAHPPNPVRARHDLGIAYPLENTESTARNVGKPRVFDLCAADLSAPLGFAGSADAWRSRCS